MVRDEQTQVRLSHHTYHAWIAQVRCDAAEADLEAFLFGNARFDVATNRKALGFLLSYLPRDFHSLFQEDTKAVDLLALAKRRYGALDHTRARQARDKFERLRVISFGDTFEFLGEAHKLRVLAASGGFVLDDNAFIGQVIENVAATHPDVGQILRHSRPATVSQLETQLENFDLSSTTARQRETRVGREGRADARQAAVASQTPTPMANSMTIPPSNNANNRTQFWVADSGASAHLCMDRTKFITYLKYNGNAVTTATGQLIKPMGIGAVLAMFEVGTRIVTIMLENVLHIPNAVFNFISERRLDASGYILTRTDGTLNISTKDGAHILTAKSEPAFSGLYAIKEHVSGTACIDVPGAMEVHRVCALPTSEEESTPSADEWMRLHRQRGHLHERALRKALKQSDPSIELPPGKLADCMSCLLAKSMRTAQGKGKKPEPESFGEEVVADLIGPFRGQGLYGGKYLSVVMDRKTRWTEVQELRDKSSAAVFRHLRAFIKRIETQTGRRPKILHTDNGREYTSDLLAKFLDKNGIEHHFSDPHTPSQNGMVERKNGVLEYAARATLIDRKLPKSFWSLAVKAMAFTQNYNPHSEMGGRSPFEVRYGKVPDTRFLREFGEVAVAHDHDEKGSMNKRGIPCRLVGYFERPGSYLVLPMRKGARPFRSGHVTFVNDSKDAARQLADIYADDRMFDDPMDPATTIPSEPRDHSDDTPFQTIEEMVESTDNQADVDTPGPIMENQTHESLADVSDTIESSPQAPVEKTMLEEQDNDMVNEHTRVLPYRRARHEALEKMRRINELLYTPRGQRQAEEAIHFVAMAMDAPRYARPIGPKGDNGEVLDWMPACDAEMQSWIEHDVADVVPKPKDKRILRPHWVFAIKRNPDGTIKKLKARCTADGSEQVVGVDCNKTYAATFQPNGIRALYSLANHLDYEIHTADVRTAYLNAKLEEEVYLEIPRYTTVWGDRRTKCLRLKRAVYGLKQAGRAWYELLRAKLLELGFEVSNCDNALFIRNLPTGREYIATHVDDMAIATPSKDTMNALKDALKGFFDLEDNDEISQFLGQQVTRDRKNKSITISQVNAIEAVVNEFCEHPTAQSRTPMSASYKPDDADPNPNPQFHAKYRSVVGHLQYFALNTRPDISYAVGVLGRYTHGPRQSHWMAVQRVLEYLRGTSKFVFIIRDGDQLLIGGYSDADHAGCPQDAASTSGFLGTIGHTPIGWASHKQKLAVRSTCDAEGIALSDLGVWTQYMRLVAQELNGENVELPPSILYCDNKSAIANTTNNRIGNGSRAAWICNRITSKLADLGIVEVRYVNSADNPADIFTKALGYDVFQKHRNTIGVSLPDPRVECQN